MSHLKGLDSTQASGELAGIYSAIQKELGMVPNLFRAIGESPRALGTFLAIGSGLKHGLLSGPEQNAIALLVAELNGCDYCLAAHSTLGRMVGAPSDEISANRKGLSSNAKRAALLKLTAELVTEKGRISAGAYREFLDAGYTPAHIPEVVLSIVQNIYTNYFNNFNGTELDFPAAEKI